MKVIKVIEAGWLFATKEAVKLKGWTFESEDGATDRQYLAAALRHLADVFDAPYEEATEDQPSIEIERATQEVIAVARLPHGGSSR